MTGARAETSQAARLDQLSEPQVGIYDRALVIQNARGTFGQEAEDEAYRIASGEKRTRAPRKPTTDETQALIWIAATNLATKAGFPDELIERLLTKDGMTVCFGESNSGKTFFALDMGCAVARGAHEWLGRRVEGGVVVYLAAESPASIYMRLQAYTDFHDCNVPNFAIVTSPIDLFDGTVDTKAVIDTVRQVEDHFGEQCRLIIGDTLARLTAGANENSGEDMGIVVRHVDRIRRECDAHFLLIHHSGKDSAKGARGWSGLRAATDTEIEITADPLTGLHAAEITKQRDIPGKGERIGFRLQSVELGTSKWGKAITSCVVLDADAPPKVERGKRPSEIAGAITELLTSRGAGMRKGEMVDHFKDRYAPSSVYRELKGMQAAGKLREFQGIVAVVRT